MKQPCMRSETTKFLAKMTIRATIKLIIQRGFVLLCIDHKWYLALYMLGIIRTVQKRMGAV